MEYLGKFVNKDGKSVDVFKSERDTLHFVDYGRERVFYYEVTEIGSNRFSVEELMRYYINN